MSSTNKGKLIVMSGPSGVGKSTVLKEVLDRLKGRLRLSVSATTRDPRPAEEEGIDYFFLSPEEFHRRREADEFLECCEVFGSGHWYGTLLSEVTPSLTEGKSVLLEIDVEGAARVLERYPEAVTIFVRPSSLEVLERRLRERGTESEEAVARRLEVAQRELRRAESYQHQVINDELAQAVSQIVEIVDAES